MSGISRRGFLKFAWLPEPAPSAAPAPSAPAPPPPRQLTRTRFQRQFQPAAGGTARVLPESCLAHLGDPCRTCVDKCPVSGALTLQEGKPSVNATLCTGCGDCERSCPAPAPGILAMPNIPNLHGNL
jgi:ferredoxin